MVSSGSKKENLTILEEIYHEKSQPKPAKRALKAFFKQYFNDEKRVEKLLSGAIIFFSLAALLLGFFQIKYNIIKGFQPKKSQNITQNTNLADQQDLLGLKNKDTDQDGLSDYDETYVYETSPYIKDSDSDGINDGDEVASGTDPNCPKGQDCGYYIPTKSAGSDLPFDLQQADVANILGGGKLTIDQLRILLKQAGMSQVDLDKVSDEEIMATYEALLAENQTTNQDQVNSNNVNSNINTEPRSINLSADQVQNMTPTQLRGLLKQSGVSSDVLDQLSDQELINLVQEALLPSTTQ